MSFIAFLLCIMIGIVFNDIVYAFKLDYDNEALNKETPRVEYTVMMIKPEISKDLIYEDDNIKIKFYLGIAVINIYIYNKTNKSIKLDYDLMSYIYVDNNSYRLYVSGTEKKDRNKPQSFSIIAPHSNFKNSVRPEFALDLPDINIFPSMGFAWNPTPEELLLSYKGKSFSFFIPLTIKGNLKDYNFTFKITDVEIIK